MFTKKRKEKVNIGFMFSGGYSLANIWILKTYPKVLFDTPNWFMAMGQRRVGKRGLFRFSAMFSLDEVTGGGDGPAAF